MTAVVLAVMLAAMPLSVSAAQGYGADNHALNVVTEPGGTTDLILFFKNGVETPLEEMTWVDGGIRGSKALSLDGKDTYLQVAKKQLETSTFTFATWINFRGSADPADPNGAYNQRLFTIGDDDDCYFTVSPHAVNNNVSNADGTLDGVYMKYFRRSYEEGVPDHTMLSFRGAEAGVTHYGLPQNEWHHMAVVVESMAVKLYIDGNLVLSENELMPVGQLNAEYMNIGKGLWGDPTLNALLDDVLMFDTSLTQEQVVALMQTGAVAALDDPAAHITTSTVYMPTAPTTTTTAVSVPDPTAQPDDKPEAPFGLPIWGFGVCVALVGVIVVITVVVNAYELGVRKAARATKETSPEADITAEEAKEDEES